MVTVTLRSSQAIPLHDTQVDGNFQGLADAINAVAANQVSPNEEIFTDGVGFTAGTSTTITTSRDYGTVNNLKVYFGGSRQFNNQIQSYINKVITFTSAIPLGITEIAVDGGLAPVLPTPPAGSVGVGQLASDTLNYFAKDSDLSVKVKNYGAVGDGITDDIVALRLARDAAPIGGVVEFEPNKVYRTSGGVQFYNATLIGNGATIKPDAAYIAAGGSGLAMGKQLAVYSSFTPFSSVSSNKNVTLPAGVTASVGDLLLFKSSDVRLASVVGDYLHGQWAIVETVSGQNIVISTPFYDTFSINAIEKWQGSSGLRVTGLTFDLTAAPNSTNYFEALNVTGANITVENCRFLGNQYAMSGVEVSGENVTIRNCFASNFRNVQGLPLPGRAGYGITANANNTLVKSNTLVDCKHGITGGPRSWVIVNPIYEGNVVTENVTNGAADGYVGSIDTHSGVSGRIIIRDNYVVGYGTMINVRSRKALITGNVLIQAGIAATAINSVEQGYDWMVIRNNRVFLASASSNLFGAYSGDTTFSDFKNITIAENYVKNGRVFSAANASPAFLNVKILNNILDGGDYVCSISGASISLDGLVIKGNTAKSVNGLAYIVSDTSNVLAGIEISGNEVVCAASSSSNHGITINSATNNSKTTTFKSISIHDNVIDQTANSGSGYVMIMSDGIFNNIKISNNIFSRGTGQSWSFRNVAFNRADFTDFLFSGNTLDTDMLTQSGTLTATFTRLQLKNNSFGQYLQSEGANDYIYVDSAISGNTLTYASFINRAGSTAWAASNELSFSNNRITAITGNGVDISSDSIGNKISFQGNTLGRRIVDASATYYSRPIGNVTLAGTPTTWKGGVGLTPMGEYTATAPPTTGSWAILSRVLNSAPTVGQPKAWVCTNSGTPGTWVSEGNL